ncbi:uncharacterized protein M6B38_340390 [Iris pallida]|uniref:Uncharacterized protein n=1 Tax=Iris pallida TaxID=29817 RepID=A0AAX6GXB6_IRIPA|nr:uncharacterized protein M6B38_340390 [Iris pallida]
MLIRNPLSMFLVRVLPLHKEIH